MYKSHTIYSINIKFNPNILVGVFIWENNTKKKIYQYFTEKYKYTLTGNKYSIVLFVFIIFAVT